jgi:beta-glucosidase
MPARFPAGFLWGAATSAYQVEGSPLADGAGASNWHRFAHTPGMVRDGDTGDIACDHYRRMPQDVALMRELGLTAYRFSISWSRVLPGGSGQVNERGLDFYRRLIDALGEAGIAPVATLFHWDLPAALEDRGGWLNPDAPSWFADYAATCVRALGGVALWATLNEPWVVADCGYLHGTLAPGHRGAFAAARAAHHLLRAHVAAAAACRPFAAGKLGVVVNLEPKHPASKAPADLAAAARADAYMNRHYLDPLLRGSYPEELRGVYGEAWDERFDAEAPQLRAPLDWLGINYYSRRVVRDDPAVWPLRVANVRQPLAMQTELAWEVYPEGLDAILCWVRDRYGALPLYVTENGAAFYDPPTPLDGRVDDPLRVDYLRQHLGAVTRALESGVDLRGYFVWSLLDNFEWSEGFSKRFGIVHVDFATQQRTVKASGRFYADVIRAHGDGLG